MDEELNESRRKFVKVWTIIILIGVLGAGLLLYFSSNKAANLKHPTELIQAVLICSTALLGLGGLLLIEFRKEEANLKRIVEEKKDKIMEIIEPMNRLGFFAFGLTYLRGCLYLSILVIISGCLYLLYDNSLFLVFTLCIFVIQILMFVFGLLYLDSQ